MSEQSIMSTKASEKLSLQITRLIDAPRDRVYAAWTNPAQLRQWFGPETTETRGLVADVRPGGEFRWDVLNNDGEEITARGEYREVEPGRKIVFTWQWDDDENWANNISVVTIELSDAVGGAKVTLTHEKLPNEESRDNHEQGWNSLLNKLENFFKK